MKSWSDFQWCDKFAHLLNWNWNDSLVVKIPDETSFNIFNQNKWSDSISEYINEKVQSRNVLRWKSLFLSISSKTCCTISLPPGGAVIHTVRIQIQIWNLSLLTLMKNSWVHLYVSLWTDLNSPLLSHSDDDDDDDVYRVISCFQSYCSVKTESCDLRCPLMTSDLLCDWVPVDIQIQSHRV